MNIADVLRGNLYLQQENIRLEEELRTAVNALAEERARFNRELRGARTIIAALAMERKPLRLSRCLIDNVSPGAELIEHHDVATGDTLYFVRERCSREQRRAV